MPVEIVNWIEIPVSDLERAKAFYENVFQFEMVSVGVGDESYWCFPDKDGGGFSGTLVEYEFTKPGKNGPLVYLNPYGDIDLVIERIVSAGGKLIEPKREIAPGFGNYAIFEDSEGNLLALQGES